VIAEEHGGGSGMAFCRTRRGTAKWDYLLLMGGGRGTIMYLWKFKSKRYWLLWVLITGALAQFKHKFCLYLRRKGR